jgi:hypothetical protein
MIPPTTRRSHHGSRRISRTHALLMFQSSCMSWSSQTIALDAVESSQRKTGSPHDS